MSSSNGTIGSPEISIQVVYEKYGRAMIHVGTQAGEASCLVTLTPEWLRFSGLYVYPAFRRRGFGRKLLKKVMTSYANLPIYLEVDPLYVDETDGMNDPELRKFYGRHGFTELPGHPYAMVRHPEPPPCVSPSTALDSPP